MGLICWFFYHRWQEFNHLSVESVNAVLGVCGECMILINRLIFPLHIIVINQRNSLVILWSPLTSWMERIHRWWTSATLPKGRDALLSSQWKRVCYVMGCLCIRWKTPVTLACWVLISEDRESSICHLPKFWPKNLVNPDIGGYQYISIPEWTYSPSLTF